MKKIKAITRYDEWNNASYYTTFNIVDRLPEIGDTDADAVITRIEPAYIDNGRQADAVYNYNYYHVISENETDTFIENIAVLKGVM